MPALVLLLTVGLHAGGGAIGTGELLGAPATPEASDPATTAREPSAPAVPGSGPPGSVPPSAGVDGETSLEAMLPDELRGITLLKVTVAPDAFEQDASTRGLLFRLGASPEDASAAFAVDPTGALSGQVVALRVAGADSEQLRDEYQAAVEALAGTELQEATIGGKDVLTGQNPEDPTSTVYFYARGDVLLFVFTPDRALAAEALSLLP